MMGNKMDAEDALQNAFIDVYKNLASYRSEASLGSWIKRIVINSCLNQLKKKKLLTNDLSESEYELYEEEETHTEYNIKVVHEAIMTLPVGYRAVLNMYLMEGYSHEEISEVLEITISTSKSQYSRAKKKLKQIIKSRNNLKLES